MDERTDERLDEWKNDKWRKEQMIDGKNIYKLNEWMKK